MNRKKNSTDYETSSRLGLRIDRDLHKKMKLIAVQEDISMTLLIENLIRDYVDNYVGKP